MGDRKNILKHTIQSTFSLSSGFSTDPTVIDYLDNCSYQIIVTTTDSVGTFLVEVSNDFLIQSPSSRVANPGTWNALTLSGTPAIAGANDTIVINLNQLPFSAFRLTYLPSTPGTGTCTVILQCKELG